MNETLRANEEVRVRKETEGFSTTFFMDFSIADRFGVACQNVKSSVPSITLSMVI